MSDFVSKDDNRIDALYSQFVASDGKRKDFLDGILTGALTGGVLSVPLALFYESGRLADLLQGEQETKDLDSQLISLTLKSLKDGDTKITEADLKFLINDVDNYSKEKVALGSFSATPFEIYDSYTDSQRERLLEQSGENVLKTFMGLGYFWKVNSDDQLYREDLIFEDQDAKFTEPFTDHVMKMADSDALDRETSKLIGEMVREDYTFNKFKRDVAQQINDTITNPAFYESSILVLGFAQDYIDFYIGLTLGDDGFYSLSQSLYSGDPTKVPQDALSEEEVASFQNPGVLQFPTTIIKDQNGETIEEMKTELLNFNELVDTDVTDYRFKFQQDIGFSTNRLGFDITNDATTSSLTKWIKQKLNNTTTVGEQIKAWVVTAYVSFLTSLIDDIKTNSLSDTIGEHYNKALSSTLLDSVLQYILFEKIIAAKKAFFDSLADATADDSDDGENITDSEREKAYRETIKNFKSGQGEAVPDDEMDEEDIENRQRYFKQCALMMNMPLLSTLYQFKLNEQYEDNIPYHGRFTTIRAQSKEQETILSNLISSKQEQKLFELETYKVSRLVPKIRLFKVFSSGGKDKEVEFIFDRTSSIDRPEVSSTNSDGGKKVRAPATRFMSTEFDKGTGVGLKNFSFEFNGTNPAEARNDITASLSLFFQSFSDFTRFRKSHKDEIYRFVDLIIQPTPDENGISSGIEVQSDRQYEPQFYRIRAEVGYVVPTDIDETGVNGFTSAERDAIRISNKSFFLNMIDHDINFRPDGSVEVKISYRAYLESLLKHPRLDALASPKLIQKRIENAKELTKQLNNKKCSVEQIKELQISLAAQERVLIKESLSSIINRLKNRKVIYKTTILKKHKDFFEKKGFFQECDFDTAVSEESGDSGDVGVVLNSSLPKSSDDFDFVDSGNRSVQFFFFGDLLYTILDCVYESEGKIRKETGFDRSSIILGSFEFQPFQSVGSSSNVVYNIADIPISVDFFSRWFVDNVVSQQSTRKTFPVMNFIRTLSNYLIKPALMENCVNRKLENRLRFQTSQITAYEKNGVNPLLPYYALPKKGRTPVSLDVDELRASEVIPFKGGPENDADSNFKDYHTYIILSALGSTLTYSGKGKYHEDIEQGRFHIHVGQNAGLVKTLSLSKSDQQYIREARFFQNGIDGLLQLSAVYVANIEMFGNTIFYPGMEIFFNPYGIGGVSFDPRKPGSDANKLGFGGYHTITSVQSSISPGKFTTSISAQQYYSGDGSGNPNVVKQDKSARKGGSIEEYSPADSTDTDGFKECKNVILNVQRYRLESEPPTTAVPPVEEAAEEVVEDTVSGETVRGSNEAPSSILSEQGFGDPEIANVSRTTETINGEPVDVVYTQYKDGTIKITKTINGVEKVSFA